MRSLFVAVEGLSGSGKTTIAGLLAAHLEGCYYKTPPKLLLPIRDAVENEAGPLVRHLFYLAGIAQASAEIRELLRVGPVVCDKYVATMLAYSRAAGVQVEGPQQGTILEPDVTFVLEVRDDIRAKRLAARGPISSGHRAFLDRERTHAVGGYFKQPGVVVVNNDATDVAITLRWMVGYLDAQRGGKAVATEWQRRGAE